MSAIEDISRPLTEVEVRLLKRKVSSQARRQKRYRARLAAVSLGLWAAGSALTLLADASSPVWIIVLAWAVIAALIAAWLLLEDRSRCSSRARSLEAALHRNQAHVIRIRSDQMVAFEEQEDEGACFAFQVEERIVFIAGQAFYPSARFPASDFSLVEFLDSSGGIVEMAIETSGKKLHPIRTIAADLQSKLRIPEHLEILTGRLDDIERLLAESSPDVSS
jgi:hypothetical protein